MLKPVVGSVALLFVSTVACAQRAAMPSCALPDTVADATEYNRLLCDANALMREGHVDRAVSLLERASTLDLHEYPNFRALPRLSLALAQAGRRSDALRVLREAELSVEVFHGISRCEATNDGFTILRPGSPQPSTELLATVVPRMCGEAFSSIYEQAGTQSLVHDLPLLELLRSVKAVVQP